MRGANTRDADPSGESRVTGFDSPGADAPACRSRFGVAAIGLALSVVQCLPEFDFADPVDPTGGAGGATGGASARAGTTSTRAGTTSSGGNSGEAGAPGGKGGCEADVLRDPMNCGECGVVCQASSGTASNTCSNGVCDPRCESGFLDCDKDPNNGCETNRETDARHCNECGRVCELSVGTDQNLCVTGQCQATCRNNYGDCNEDALDGCEELLVRNALHCGACGRACLSGGATHATTNACSTSGECVPECESGWGACSKPEDGCVTSLETKDNCGACARACSGNAPECLDFACQASIELANHTTGEIQGPRLTIPHTLQNGPNRLILLAVMGHSWGSGGIGQARPDTVTYDGKAMVVVGEQDGGVSGTRFSEVHLFFYMLTEPLGVAGTKQIVIDGEDGPAPQALIGHVLQFNGVRQTKPLSAQAKGAVFDLCKPISQMVTVETAGSVIYSMATAQYAGLGSPDFSMIQLLDRELGTVRVVGGQRGLNPLLTKATVPVGWRFEYCSSATHYAVAIHPNQTP